MRKTFDTVAWMRRRRAQIDEEDRSLTWEQKRQKTHEEALRDPLLSCLCEEITLPPGKPPANMRK